MPFKVKDNATASALYTFWKRHYRVLLETYKINDRLYHITPVAPAPYPSLWREINEAFVAGRQSKDD